MTARKNQTQAIVLQGILKGIFKPSSRWSSSLDLASALDFSSPLHCASRSRELVLRRIKSCPAMSTQSINGFESGRRN
jgi:hypothetical protein